MDHLAQDLTVALEESESCGPIALENGGKWGMRRRTRSAGNLHLYLNRPGDHHSDESSSSNSEMRTDKHRNKLVSFHQSDSDDMSLSIAVAKALNQRTSLRMKHPIHNFLRGVSHSLESDSVNEHSPARPNLRRKRKLKRMSIDETPIPPCGKRKRSQRLEIVDNGRSIRHTTKIKPLHQSIVDKIEKFCHPGLAPDDPNSMETQSIDDNCDIASESSISWSGGEGHEGDDELTDWAPSMDNPSIIDQSPWNDTDPREIRAGCRRLREERPSFSISTGANERVAKFLQDTTKSELRIYGAEREKLGQLAALYSLDLWFESPSSSLLRKTSRTPSMQPTQRHHSSLSAVHKRLRIHSHIVS
ncbi:G patch domain-containing protein 2 isoform X2 [Anoplophora glabripennis]|uniref:G patch domain-containing protein 2 isoform X2 n=1 Tax=Anoplophora glabripennis TaxID=217634 RepID=UPI000873A7AA|nr:G patch domain-containing protein 2 isoform X2 [Anoplophora glabripennis]